MTVVPSGFYIFNEPLKQAAIEAKARDAREKGGGTQEGSGASSSSVDASSSSDLNSNKGRLEAQAASGDAERRNTGDQN